MFNELEQPAAILYTADAEQDVSTSKNDLHAILHLTKALFQARKKTMTKLLYVAPGTKELPVAEHSMIASFCKSLAQENPKLQSKILFLAANENK